MDTVGVLPAVRERIARDAFASRGASLLAAILAWAFLLTAGGAPAVNAAPALPGAHDLAADGASARSRKRPIVLFFNRFDCPYCERALREYLVPMQRDPAFAGRAIFRQVEIDQPLQLVDFGGRATTHGAYATRFKVRLTPTIWFVDGDGNALTEPIVGLRTVDFYGWYLEQAIAEAQAKLDARAGAP